MKDIKQHHSQIKEILFRPAEIQAGIKTLAEKMNQYYANRSNSIVFVGILKGCLQFMVELTKQINFDPIIDFMVISSYSGGTEKKFVNPKLVLDLDVDVSGKDIVIIDDIGETGKTIQLVKKRLIEHKATDVKVATLIWKKTNNESQNVPDGYVFIAPQKFLVGFGLDYKEKMRILPYVGVLDKK